MANSAPFINIPNYPEMDTVYKELSALPNVIMLDVDTLAKDTGVPRAANMVLLGAASPILGIDQDKLEAAIAQVFGRKGQEIVDMNIKAFRAGRAVGEEQVKAAKSK